MAREHNAANILCLGERVTAAAYALEIVNEWLGAKFGGADGDDGIRARHQRRIDKIKALESK
jgi:ribose 5-phosphate isomerase B